MTHTPTYYTRIDPSNKPPTIMELLNTHFGILDANIINPVSLQTLVISSLEYAMLSFISTFMPFGSCAI